MPPYATKTFTLGSSLPLHPCATCSARSLPLSTLRCSKRAAATFSRTRCLLPLTASTGHVSFIPCPSVVSSYCTHTRTAEELESLPITRFRPNIIVDGPTMVPWEEDGWTSLELLDATTRAPPAAEAKGTGRGVYLLEKCARCMVPNIDPETGVRDNFLPYRVLQQYRQVDPAAAEKGKPCFGMLSVPREKSTSLPFFTPLAPRVVYRRLTGPFVLSQLEL